MEGCGFNSSLWRLRVNWVLAMLVPPTLYSISTLAYLTSFHRFVTNPRKESINNTLAHDDKILPGLGESDFFYSFLISVFYAAACTATLLTGFLVRCIPYWYLYVIATSSHILGYTLYGVATQGWQLIISQLLAGYYGGSEYALSFCYLTDSSARYAELKRENGAKVSKNYDTELRNKLLGFLSFGYLLGFPIGPGVAVLFSYLKIDQFHSIAWFNVAFGIAQLLLFVFLFRGESGCKKIGKCREFFICTGSTTAPQCPSPLQFFVIVSMALLSLIDMFKSGIVKTLLNPILSDSFGLSLKYSSFVYLALTLPRLIGSLLLIFLQRLKLSSQMILLIGVSITMTAYLLLTDWQTIPYDPCTEYSPFHHPEILKNQSGNSSSISTASLNHSKLFNELRLNLTSEMKLEGGTVLYSSGNMDTIATCRLNPTCPRCEPTVPLHQEVKPCLIFETIENNDIMNVTNSEKSVNVLRYSCSSKEVHTFCININTQEMHYFEEKGHNQLQMLHDGSTYSQYSVISNSCIKAVVPGRKCHWIPFSTVTKSVCNDCPPICRAQEQTLNIVQFSAGLFALLVGMPTFWMPLMATATDYSPKQIRSIVIGCISTSNLVAQSLTPLILDKVYEATQKRTFLITLVLTALHIPFVVEIVILYFHARKRATSFQTQASNENNQQAAGNQQ